MHSAFRYRPENDTEQAAGAGKIPPPERVTWATLQRGMQHASNLGPLLKPACHLERRSMMLRESHPHGAQTAQAQIHVIGADAKSQQMHRVAQAFPCAVAGRDCAEHEVGVATDV